MMQLNSQQQKAVEHENGPALVVASPGSGKTRVITERVVHLIEKGVDPSQILCVTFTNKAAKEMKQRIVKRLGYQYITTTISTFHAFCAKILREFSLFVDLERNFSIFDETDQKALIFHIARNLGINKKKIDSFFIARTLNVSRENLDTYEELVARFDGDDLSWEIAKKYSDEMRTLNSVDFSGLLSETVRLFKEHPAILNMVRERYSYIQVDECHDTNYIQFHLINLLGKEHKNILIVADLDQSIYAFRNARYKNILDFLQQYKACKQYPLGKNYRSTPQIIAVANSLIKHNSSYIDKGSETDNLDGPNPRYKSFETPKDEAIAIANRIEYYVKEEGYDNNDIAVFYRLNRLSLDIQQALQHLHIPFCVIGGPSFFDRREIKDSIAMLRFLSNTKDVASFYRIIDMFSGIGEITAHKLHTLSQKKEINLLDACRNIDKLTNRTPIRKAAERIVSVFDFDYKAYNLSECFGHIFDQTKYDQFLLDHAKNTKDYQERKDNIGSFIADVVTETKNNIKNIETYLNDVMLASAEDVEAENKVSLMSIHAAKGLEFPIVFVIGMEQNIMPHYLAIQDANNPTEKIEAIEEERRVAYVALTRCKKLLHLSSCKQRLFGFGKKLQVQNCSPSQFLHEAGLIKKWKTIQS
jgi:DNA helicase-2/ATP-dependent DNA helicase PcrA